MAQKYASFRPAAAAAIAAAASCRWLLERQRIDAECSHRFGGARPRVTIPLPIIMREQEDYLWGV